MTKKILYALGLKTSCITTELNIIVYLSTVYVTRYSHIINRKEIVTEVCTEIVQLVYSRIAVDKQCLSSN